MIINSIRVSRIRTRILILHCTRWITNRRRGTVMALSHCYCKIRWRPRLKYSTKLKKEILNLIKWRQAIRRNNLLLPLQRALENLSQLKLFKIKVQQLASRLILWMILQYSQTKALTIFLAQMMRALDWVFKKRKGWPLLNYCLIKNPVKIHRVLPLIRIRSTKIRLINKIVNQS